MNNINEINSDAENETALARIMELLGAKPNSPESVELHNLSMLVEEFEKVHYPITPPDPVYANRFRAEQQL